ncbi:GTP pyrophosphokinase, partial [Halonatronum saccharophilum]|uniref:GTP pyrophosphokinase n=1 Tax=Halonatronum saccharophilum TaxID=150060 RepID=UPI0004B67D22
MEEDKIKAILNEYDEKYGLYELFTEKTKKLIEELLEGSNINIHSINSRAKEKSSLKNKLKESEEEYNNLSDITDLSGVRIITFFEDEVDKVAKIIKREFEIDYGNSVDKRNLLEPDRFGYLSLHYILKLSPHRLKLAENKKFKDYKVEIQISSILQHAWAEIEHDLGYKSEEAVPREIRRKFSRLAGLLEIADIEFVRIRDELKKHKKEL